MSSPVRVSLLWEGGRWGEGKGGRGEGGREREGRKEGRKEREGGRKMGGRREGGEGRIIILHVYTNYNYIPKQQCVNSAHTQPHSLYTWKPQFR